MNNMTWLLPLAMMGVAWFLNRQNLQQRLRDVEIKLAKVMQHVGFEPDMSAAPPNDAVLALARTPGKKVAAIKAYREQTGAGLKEAKDVIEALEGRVPPTL